MPAITSILAGLAVATVGAGAVSQADTDRRSAHSQQQQQKETLAAQKVMADKQTAADAKASNIQLATSKNAKRKQLAAEGVSKKYGGRGRASTILSDSLG